MSGLFFLPFLVVLWRLSPQPKRLERTLACLETWERAARRHPRERLPVIYPDGPDFFAQAVRGGLRRGESMAERVAILRHTCRTVLRQEAKRKRLWLLPLFRVSSFLIVLMVLTYVLGPAAYSARKMLLGGFWVIAGTFVWRQLLGKLWFWEDEGTHWWAAVLSFQERAGEEWRERWIGMQRGARRRGEAFAGDWERVLQDWAEKRHRREEMRLERLEETLVLWELGVCLPAAGILLSGPLLQMLEPVLKSL